MVLAESLGELPRSIIVNGQVVTHHNSLILVQNVKHKLQYLAPDKTVQDTATCDGLIRSMFKGNMYAECVNSSAQQAERFQQDIDPFTGSVVIRSKGFINFQETCMSQQDPTLTREEKIFWSNLSNTYIRDYYETFRILLQRRLGQKMPYHVRGRLVKGLYQPIVVATPYIVSPFAFPENEWFLDMFNGAIDVPCKSSDNQRRLDLSCVSMWDYCRTLNTPIVQELDFKVFMLANCLALLSHSQNRTAANAFHAKYQHLIQSTFNQGPPAHATMYNDLLQMIRTRGGI